MLTIPVEGYILVACTVGEDSNPIPGDIKNDRHVHGFSVVMKCVCFENTLPWEIEPNSHDVWILQLPLYVSVSQWPGDVQAPDILSAGIAQLGER